MPTPDQRRGVSGNGLPVFCDACIYAGSTESNEKDKRPPPGVKIERKRSVRVSALLGAETGSGGSPSSICWSALAQARAVPDNRTYKTESATISQPISAT